MIEVVNRQRKVPIDCERWQTFTEKALKVAPDDADFKEALERVRPFAKP